MRTPSTLSAAAIAAVIFATGLAPAYADSPAEFYNGRQVTLVIPAGPGGSYGMYGQVGKAALEKFIPGVTIVMQYMPGAGGAKAANYIASAAPRDGSYITNLFGTAAQTQLFRPDTIHYDAAKIPFIGQYAPVPSIISVRSDAPATSIEEIKNTEVALGSSGVGSQQSQIPILLNALIGTRFKVITGYRGSSDIFHAIETGELHGALASNVSWMTIKPGWIDNKTVIPIFQLGRKPAKGFEGAALVEDITDDAENRQILHAMSTGAIIGRSLAGVPDIPADRLQYLREAFRKGMHDPEILSLAERLKLPIEYTSGQDLDRLTLEILATPKPVIDKIKMILDIRS